MLHYLLLPQIAGARKSLTVIAGMNPLLLLAGFVAEAASLVAYAQLTRSLLPRAGRPSIISVLRVQLATLAASHVVPGGAAAGTPIGYRLLRRTGVSSSDASFVLSVQGIGSAAVLNLVLWVALIVSLPLRGANAAYLGVALLGAVVIGAFALLVAAISRGSTVADRIVQAGRHVRFLDPHGTSVFLHRLVDRFRQLASDRRLMARAAGWAVLQWITDSLSLWICLAALGVITDPDGLLVAFGIANVSAAIPLTPGGVGVYEAVLTSSLVGFGVPRAEAIIGVLAYRLFEFWLPIPIGAVAYLTAQDRPADEHASRLEGLDSAYSTSRTVARSQRSWARRRRARTAHRAG